ncbi:hypothetical protein FDG2_5494 [Candidatus Protofrankia californiensis]|uniref:Uncharacterized protein n=1 Tax=Candidatus Protofrankia californiensis TaxID=1839754 RepID=A0A1C3PDZ7_9ACTN|nr:hypothetical protein FDG2_5494 [Candidatus Protofrankia californiensis]
MESTAFFFITASDSQSSYQETAAVNGRNNDSVTARICQYSSIQMVTPPRAITTAESVERA